MSELHFALIIVAIVVVTAAGTLAACKLLHIDDDENDYDE
jgi:hypothetical protein